MQDWEWTGTEWVRKCEGKGWCGSCKGGDEVATPEAVNEHIDVSPGQERTVDSGTVHLLASHWGVPFLPPILTKATKNVLERKNQTKVYVLLTKSTLLSNIIVAEMYMLKLAAVFE